MTADILELSRCGSKGLIKNDYTASADFIALHETIRRMGQIDEVIEEHGGWPVAFTADRQESQ